MKLHYWEFFVFDLLFGAEITEGVVYGKFRRLLNDQWNPDWGQHQQCSSGGRFFGSAWH
jgi:hypothetical protein